MKIRVSFVYMFSLLNFNIIHWLLKKNENTENYISCMALLWVLDYSSPHYFPQITLLTAIYII